MEKQNDKSALFKLIEMYVMHKEKNEYLHIL